MKKIKNLLNQLGLELVRYEEKENIIIINTNKGKFVIKNNRYIDKNKIFNYLDSRNFNNYLRPIYTNDEYDIYPYIDCVNTPVEEKAIDIINIISFLHNKTTFYRNINLDKIKEKYEDLSNKIIDLNNYYHNLQDNIEEIEYMSPSNYLVIRNCSFIYSNLNFCKECLDNWYKIISSKKKERVVTLHNNLSIDHILEGKDKYLISWDRSFKASPIYDLYSLFINNYDLVDFNSLYKLYLSKYPLLEEEQLLFFVLISMPKKIELETDELKQCITIRNMLDRMANIRDFVLDNRTKEEKEKQP
ncbi:MAG: hypothetical protein ACI4OT_01965 [Bacilli bacterium]